MRGEENLPEPRLVDDGIQVADLARRGVRIAGRFIRGAPTREIECNDATRRRKKREETVVEVQGVAPYPSTQDLYEANAS